MKVHEHPTEQDVGVSGFSTVDEKGRISLSKPVRTALGVRPGSAVAYILLDHALLLIPQDEHLTALMDNAVRALATAGLTVQDLLDELPAARAEVVEEAYGKEFMETLERQRLALHSSERPGA